METKITTNRERLATLLRSAVFKKTLYNSDDEPIGSFNVRAVADDLLEPLTAFLIAHGVVVPPCKVGDTIYFDTYRRGESIGTQPHKVAEVKVTISIERPFGCVGAEIPDWEFGKTVFLTPEEAEKALTERKEK